MKFVDKKSLTFDDILLLPQYSEIVSRKDVDTSVNFLGLKLEVPFISSNMDTITESPMAIALWKAGAIGCLHRFQSIKDNVDMFKKVLEADAYCMVSIGVGVEEFERGAALIRAGAKHLVIDVAHGASLLVAQQFNRIKEYSEIFNQEHVYIIVGNFATFDSYWGFLGKLEYYQHPDAIKIGIGGGSNCSTRVQTGHGLGNVSTILEFNEIEVPLIIDGGIRNSGDAVKALACGANLIMGGNIISGTDETPGKQYHNGSEIIHEFPEELAHARPDMNLLAGHMLMTLDGIKAYNLPCTHKQYRGSASSASYEAQGKSAEHRPPEGVSRLVKYKGPVTPIIKEFQAGIKSGLSYSGAKNIEEFQEKALITEVSHATMNESLPKGSE